MDPKPRPLHRIYIDILRRMTPEQRLLKAFELSETSKSLLQQGLRALSRFARRGISSTLFETAGAMSQQKSLIERVCEILIKYF